MSSSPDLPTRVNDLESEIQQLRRRVNWLETQSGVSAEPVATPAPNPLVSLAVESPVAEVEPPPIPVTVPPIVEPTPRTPPPVVSTTPPPLPKPSRWHELLAAVNLVPPKVGENGEAQIGGWWATRIGALLAVMGVVFFGVYVSAHTASWVKWLELALIAGGVTAAGAWLEKKSLRVGPVITGAGYALIFFTAFAAYAVDPVKIVNSPWLAAALQAVAVGYIGWSGWRRDSATTATMAVMLGYVSAFFAVFEEFQAMSSVAGLLMAGAAVVLCQRRNWWVPVFLSVVLTPILTIAMMISDRNDFGPLYIYSLVLAGFALHLSLAYLAAANGSAISTRLRRLQTVNTSLGLLAGLIATAFLDPEVSYAVYFLGAGLVLLGVTTWTARKVPGEAMVNMLAVKTASLFALAAIAHWDARTRWIALLIEAGVLLFAAHRSGRNSLCGVTLVVWVLSLGFFTDDAVGLHRDIISTTGLASLIYVFASLILMDQLARQWHNSAQKTHTPDWLLGALAALPVWLLCSDSFEQAWAPVGGTALAMGLGAFAYLRRSRVGIPSALVAFVTAHLATQFWAETFLEVSWLWAGAAPLGVGTLLLGYVVAGSKRTSEPLGNPNRSRGALGLGLLGAAALIGAIMQTLPAEQALVATAVFCVVIAAIGLKHPEPEFTIGGMISLFTGGVLFLAHQPGAVSMVDGTWALRFMAFAAALLWVLGSRRKEATNGGMSGAHLIVALVSVPVIWQALGNDLSPLWLALSLVAVGTLFSAIAQRCRVNAAFGAASALGVIGLLRFTMGSAWMRTDQPTLSLIGLAVLIFAVAMQPLIAFARGLKTTTEVARLWTIGHAVIAAGAITLITLNERAAWQDYGTVLWAVGGIGLFGLGIVGRAKSHRLAGLILLLFCISRVFVHDIEEAKHRIAAFIVLGVLLLWVGFSYQKFRHFIDESSPDKES